VRTRSPTSPSPSRPVELLDRVHRVNLYRQAQRRHQIVMRPHPERPVLFSRVFVDPDLVVEQLFGQRLSFPRPRKMKAPALKQGLEPGDQERLAQADPHLSPLDRRRPRSPWVK